MSENNGNRILLDHSLTIQDVGEMMMQIRSAFEEAREIYLDIGSLTHIDGAGMQLLCEIIKEAKTQRISLKWIGESESLKTVARAMGVDEWLGLYPITDN
jgi:anti-anti-sigma factor